MPCSLLPPLPEHEVLTSGVLRQNDAASVRCAARFELHKSVTEAHVDAMYLVLQGAKTGSKTTGVRRVKHSRKVAA